MKHGKFEPRTVLSPTLAQISRAVSEYLSILMVHVRVPGMRFELEAPQ